MPSKTIDPLRFREGVGHYASGITVITSQLDEEPLGFTCQSFYSVSMSPALISFSVMKSSASYPKIRQSGKFLVNILSDKQIDISNKFAKRGTAKWHDVEWIRSPLGNPIISGSLHWIDCTIHAEHSAGDHLIVIGEVKEMDEQSAKNEKPLLYFKGNYLNMQKD